MHHCLSLKVLPLALAIVNTLLQPLSWIPQLLLVYLSCLAVLADAAGAS